MMQAENDSEIKFERPIQIKALWYNLPIALVIDSGASFSIIGKAGMQRAKQAKIHLKIEQCKPIKLTGLGENVCNLIMYDVPITLPFGVILINALICEDIYCDIILGVPELNKYDIYGRSDNYVYFSKFKGKVPKLLSKEGDLTVLTSSKQQTYDGPNYISLAKEICPNINENEITKFAQEIKMPNEKIYEQWLEAKAPFIDPNVISEVQRQFNLQPILLDLKGSGKASMAKVRNMLREGKHMAIILPISSWNKNYATELVDRAIQLPIFLPSGAIKSSSTERYSTSYALIRTSNSDEAISFRNNLGFERMDTPLLMYMLRTMTSTMSIFSSHEILISALHFIQQLMNNTRKVHDDIIAQEALLETKRIQNLLEDSLTEEDDIMYIPKLEQKQKVSNIEFVKTVKSIGEAMIKAGVDKEYVRRLEALLIVHGKVFEDPEGGQAKVDPHVIEITIDKLHYKKKFTKKEQELIKNSIERLLAKGMIRRSHSPYCSSILLLPKKDGDVRLVVDYRAVNDITVMDAQRMPDTITALEEIQQSKYFTLIDLCQAYWQIPLAEESRKYTAFVGEGELWEWNVLPFGLKTAPQTFARITRTITEGIESNVYGYFDDLLIHTNTLEEHLDYLNKVLTKLDQLNLKAKLQKCHFMKKEIIFLGHKISAQGIAVNFEKVELRSLQQSKN